MLACRLLTVYHMHLPTYKPCNIFFFLFFFTFILFFLTFFPAILFRSSRNMALDASQFCRWNSTKWEWYFDEGVAAVQDVRWRRVAGSN